MPIEHNAKILNEAKTLLSEGFEVTVISWDRERKHPKKRNFEGLTIFNFQCPLRLSSKISMIFSLPAFWLFVTKILMSFNPEIVYNINFDTIIPTLAYTKLKRKKSICYIAEFYFARPLHKGRSWHLIVLSRLFQVVERILLRKVDHLIVLTVPMKIYYKKILSVPITVINNPSDLNVFYFDKNVEKGEDFILLYTGDLKRNNSFLLNVLEAIRDIKNVKVMIVGEIHKNVLESIRKYNNVVVKHRVPLKELRRYYNLAHCVFALYDSNHPNVECCMPTKVMEALACGVPVLVNKGIYISKIVRKYQVGFCVDENSIHEIGKAILKMKNDKKLWNALRENAIKISRQRYNWGKESQKFIKVFKFLQKP